MKKLIVILAFALLGTTTSFAQKFAYVDTEAVLSELPAYQNAQQQVDQFVANWKKEIEKRYKDIDEMYRQFQAEQVLLTANEKAKREEAIVAKERETRSFQKQKFGAEGDLAKKRQELVAPIQDQVFEAIETVAKRKGLDFVLDKSGGASILYYNPEFDITADVTAALK
ncbi:MAG: OmpH family outer membrane protein [Chitinophagales bacterium]